MLIFSIMKISFFQVLKHFLGTYSLSAIDLYFCFL